MVLVNSVSNTIESVWFAVDVYKADIRAKHASDLVALAIMVFQGDAEALWHLDALEPQNRNWAISPLKASTPHIRFKERNLPRE